MNEPDGRSEKSVTLFQKREIRRTMHDGEWWFAITDVIAALTDSTDPSDYWKKIRKEIEGVTRTNRLQRVSADEAGPARPVHSVHCVHFVHSVHSVHFPPPA